MGRIESTRPNPTEWVKSMKADYYRPRFSKSINLGIRSFNLISSERLNFFCKSLRIIRTPEGFCIPLRTYRPKWRRVLLLGNSK